MISSLRTGIPGQRQELWQIGQGHRVLGLSGALQALCALLLGRVCKVGFGLYISWYE